MRIMCFSTAQRLRPPLRCDFNVGQTAQLMLLENLLGLEPNRTSGAERSV